MFTKRLLLGQMLLKKGFISDQELEKGLREQISLGERIGKTLVALGYVSEENMLATLAEQLNVPFVKAKDFPEDLYKNGNFPLRYMQEYCFLPLRKKDDAIVVALADPLNACLLDNLCLFLGMPIQAVLSPVEDILSSIEAHYGSGASTMQRIIGDMSEDDLEIVGDVEESDITHLRDMAFEAPVIKLVNLVISRAVEAGASDIHLEPFEDTFRIRYRVDGILHDTESPPKRLQAAVISRVKIMAEMNIAERRLPQDGRFQVKFGTREVDLRVSTIPTVLGEKVVLRLLDKSKGLIKLEQLGFTLKQLKKFKSIIYRSYGIILITGPTGSGKTTTLYAALNQVNSKDKNIITVEDPVEYKLSRINQIQILPKINLTFANALRSILRQDPDIIMVGEIRDAETAQIAVQAALTGHLVFSTLHTNDAASALTRLIDMNVETFLISSSVIGVIAQRLVRVICEKCKEEYIPGKDVLKGLDIKANSNGDGNDDGEVKLYRGKGCSFCKNTGYFGRTSIYELIVLDEEIRELIISKASSNIIKETAIKKGMKTLKDSGLEKVLQGITTIEEVLRVAG